MQDFLRFLLAFSVVIFHHKHFAIQTALGETPSNYLAPFSQNLRLIYDFGYHAVAVFFFLSGFMLTLRNSFGNSNTFSFSVFVTNRLARIYPAHLLTLFIMAGISLFVSHSSTPLFMSYNDNVFTFIGSIFLLNGTGLMADVSFNLPAWSLSVEFICYLILAFTYVLKQAPRIKHLAALFFVGILINEISHNPNVDNVGSGITFFFAGAITAVAFARKSHIFRENVIFFSLIFLCQAIVTFYLSFKVTLGLQKLIWLTLSLPSSIIFIQLVDEIINKRFGRIFKWFGMVSFSIYIWHFPVQSILFYYITFFGIDSPNVWYNAESWFWIYMFSTLVIAQLSLLSVERWGSKFVKQSMTQIFRKA